MNTVNEVSAKYCESFNKHRTKDNSRIKLWLDRILESGCFHEKVDFLDIGCGVGRFTIPLSEYVRHSNGIDRSADMIQLAMMRTPKKINWSVGVVENIPLESASVNVVFASMLLEHIPNKSLFFEECRRVLRAKGSLILRTMLPEDIGNTTWYEFTQKAAELEIKRTISLSEMKKLASPNGCELVSAKSFRDLVDSDIAQQLPKRLSEKSYEVLHRVGDDEVSKAVEHSSLALKDSSFKEYMSSSLVVFRAGY